jgi:hypothetical protein
MKRISAPEQTREQLRALIEGRLGTAPDRSSLVLLAARLILVDLAPQPPLKAVYTENFTKRNHLIVALFTRSKGCFCSRPSTFPNMVVHHVPVGAAPECIYLTIST